MSKTFKIPFNHLLIKVEEASYKTPCNKYSIQYTNWGMIDDINWVVKTRGIIFAHGENLDDVMISLVKKDPFLDTELYEILYGIEEKD